MSSPSLSTGHAGIASAAVALPPDPIEIRAYRLLTRLMAPAAPALLHFRARKGKEDPQRQGERLGRASLARPDGPLVWIHAASVGETSSILPVIAALEAARPDVTVLLTTGTVTSARFAQARLPKTTLHQYVPLDSPAFVQPFLDFWRPSLGIFTEQEIWPNLILSCRARHIPLALVNARMSETSYARWSQRKAFADALFTQFGLILAQSRAYGARFETLGSRCVAVVGNLKIDVPPPPRDPAAFATLAAAIGGRTVVVAASTHEGEEAIVAEAHTKLLRTIPDVLTIVAPRHPERGSAVCETLAATGLELRRRSLGQLPDASTSFYVADTIGELGTLYGLGPVAFIGGSLIPHGGQNPVEAIRHDAVVVTGPSIFNFEDTYSHLIAAGGARQVTTSAELADTLCGLLTDLRARDEQHRNAIRTLTGLSGALATTLGALLPFVPKSETAPGDAVPVSFG